MSYKNTFTFILLVCMPCMVIGQNFQKTFGSTYKQGAIYTTNSSDWANAQNFSVFDFTIHGQTHIKNQFYFHKGITTSQKRGYFNNNFSSNAIVQDDFIEIPLGFRMYTPLATDKLYLRAGFDVYLGVSFRQQRFFEPNTQIPDEYETTLWLSSGNLGFGGDVSLVYNLTEKFWLKAGIDVAQDIMNFTQDDYQDITYRRSMFSVGLIYTKTYKE